jgi:DNA-directed RNA polymerase subunit RPC12/RpoP
MSRNEVHEYGCAECGTTVEKDYEVNTDVLEVTCDECFWYNRWS